MSHSPKKYHTQNNNIWLQLSIRGIHNRFQQQFAHYFYDFPTYFSNICVKPMAWSGSYYFEWFLLQIVFHTFSSFNCFIWPDEIYSKFFKNWSSIDWNGSGRCRLIESWYEGNIYIYRAISDLNRTSGRRNKNYKFMTATVIDAII